MVCATISQVQVDILLGWQILVLTLTLSLMIEIFVVHFYDDTVCSGSYDGYRIDILYHVALLI